MIRALQAISSFIHNRWIKKLSIGIEIILLVATVSFAIRIVFLKKTVIPVYEKILQKKLNDQIKRISAFLDLQKKNMEDLAKDELILGFMEKASGGKDVSAALDNELSDHLKKIQENIEYKSLSLITKSGIIRFSTNPLLRNINLNDEAYSNTPIFRSFHICSLTLTSFFSDFLYSPIAKNPAFYVTNPLIKNNKLVGIIAYQIDEKELNTITRDYLDLGSTGEIVLAEQIGTEAFFITPTRNKPSIKFSKINLFGSTEYYRLQQAALGQSSSGTGIDYLGAETLAVWSYIPQVSWAIVVKINLDEINEPLKRSVKYFILLTLCTLLFGVLTLFINREYFMKPLELAAKKILHYFPNKFRNFIVILLIIFASLGVASIYQFKHALSSELEKSQKQAIEEINKGIQLIDADLDKIQLLANFIAHDLQTERLISEDIKKRLRREIVETEGLVRITIAYKPYNHDNERLYAPSIVQNEGGIILEERIEKSYDYTDKNEGLNKILWYTLPMETKKPLWLNPRIDPVSHDMVITYSLPFFFSNDKSDPAGIISISYKLDRFAKIAQNIGIGATGYTFLISQDTTFLYHPIEKYTLQKETFLQFAQEEGNESLERIAKEIKAQKPILTQILNKEAQSESWIYTRPISKTGWTIATVFSSEEIGLSKLEIRRHLFIINIYMTIALLLCSFALAKSYTRNNVYSFTNLSNLIIFTGLLFLWITIYYNSSIEPDSNVFVSSQSGLNKFITKQIEEAKRKNEPIPVAIPVGIEVYSLEQTSPTHVSFSGHIWHKYHKTLHKDIERNIRIPSVISYTVLSQNTISVGDWDIVEMNVTATVFDEHDYKTYPLDEHHIKIPFEYPDYTKNILLVPDLDAYASIDPSKLPGLDKTTTTMPFFAKASYFDFVKFSTSTNYGAGKFEKPSEEYELTFNTVKKKEILVPFIYFLMPLLIILISIFAVLVLEQKETSPYTIIGPFTALFFALVLLHRSLHEAAPAKQTLYIEYAFFYSYLVIILLVIHTMLIRYFQNNEAYQRRVIPFLKIIFWPLQLTAWFITTVFVFY